MHNGVDDFLQFAIEVASRSPLLKADLSDAGILTLLLVLVKDSLRSFASSLLSDDGDILKKLALSCLNQVPNVDFLTEDDLEHLTQEWLLQILRSVPRRAFEVFVPSLTRAPDQTASHHTISRPCHRCALCALHSEMEQSSVISSASTNESSPSSPCVSKTEDPRLVDSDVYRFSYRDLTQPRAKRIGSWLHVILLYLIVSCGFSFYFLLMPRAP
jgi:hypothetical protein